MFEKKTKTYTDFLGKTNRIVEGTQLQGTILSPADIRIDGHLLGNLKTNGKLIIGPTGIIKGDIICKNADIEGVLEGKIQVDEILSLKSKANVMGEVICGKLSVEPGATFSATCFMKPNQKTITSNEQPK
ncbi:MAG: cytoskeletal protein CcmA (bactofilin family) [Flavobacterium sp.]|jgi:cytoskeletal protein CcmA (bactofilin family)